MSWLLVSTKWCLGQAQVITVHPRNKHYLFSIYTDREILWCLSLMLTPWNSNSISIIGNHSKFKANFLIKINSKFINLFQDPENTLSIHFKTIKVRSQSCNKFCHFCYFYCFFDSEWQTANFGISNIAVRSDKTLTALKLSDKFLLHLYRWSFSLLVMLQHFFDAILFVLG